MEHNTRLTQNIEKIEYVRATLFLMALLPIITQGHNALQNFDSENSTQRDHRKIAFVTVSIVSLGMILHVVTKVLVRNSRESKSDLT